MPNELLSNSGQLHRTYKKKYVFLALRVLYIIQMKNKTKSPEDADKWEGKVGLVLEMSKL